MTRNYVGDLIHRERARRSMTFGDLARACGATGTRQVSRLARRIVALEREGLVDERLVAQIVAALNLDAEAVHEALRQQHDEELERWRVWADEPVQPEIHIRPFAGFWYQHELPPEVAHDEHAATEYARKLTENREEVRVVLLLSRRRSLSFARGRLSATKEAAPGTGVTPFMEIAGQQVVFVSKT